MEFTGTEKEYVKIVVKRELERFLREKIVTDETIVFLQGEKNYESFLREILKKLDHGKAD
jgi:hypothetical protein